MVFDNKRGTVVLNQFKNSHSSGELKKDSMKQVMDLKKINELNLRFNTYYETFEYLLCLWLLQC